ncbi:hypothetical protein QE152_g21597 [Popillia japonica]|uniref:Uncharacterized protein n=1 Tax=Popillia japonica TaxID=7064 RepID=A0AAW1KLK3_POPJA
MEIVYGEDQNVCEEDQHEWEEEDNLPLCKIQKELLNKKYIWLKDIKYCNILNRFTEDYGSNIPSDCETTIDVFLQVFPEHLISHTCFQTNLFELKKMLTNSETSAQLVLVR